jgi:hypothetical protein
MGLDVSDLRGFKAPMPTKGEYDLEIVDAREFVGKKEDENGEVTTGVSFKLKIVGPDFAQLTTGEPAVGFTFENALMLPRKSLLQKNPQVAGRMKKEFASRLEACFGNEFPGTVEPSDWAARQFRGELYVSWDDYAKDDVVRIGSVSQIAA